ncbi:hypothetical protein ACJ5H2_13450 [Nocardioides sp. R1-1]|uniref:hypothetical protein n=1 Tax=Nocardioides sp. R1-1 TaxID=3383502 RepID=UPI0038D1C5B8
MSDTMHSLTVVDDLGDALTVNALPRSLEVRTTGGRTVVLDHDSTQVLRRFLVAHLPATDE